MHGPSDAQRPCAQWLPQQSASVRHALPSSVQLPPPAGRQTLPVSQTRLQQSAFALHAEPSTTQPLGTAQMPPRHEPLQHAPSSLHSLESGRHVLGPPPVPVVVVLVVVGGHGGRGRAAAGAARERGHDGAVASDGRAKRRDSSTSSSVTRSSPRLRPTSCGRCSRGSSVPTSTGCGTSSGGGASRTQRRRTSPEGTVKSRLRTARQKMCALIGEILPPSDRGGTVGPAQAGPKVKGLLALGALPAAPSAPSRPPRCADAPA